MTTAEQLIETDLHELLGGQTPPDLIARTVERIVRGVDENIGARSVSEGAPAESADSSSAIAGPFAYASGSKLRLRRLAVAACALLTLGLMTWVLWPRPLPGSVTPTTYASYRVKEDHIELKSGWLLLTDGAPEVRVDTDHVREVQGRAVAGTGIPNAQALDALATELNLSNTEKEMLKTPKRWLTAGGLALCLLTGQAMLNGQQVKADDQPKPQLEENTIKLPKPDDVAGVKKLFKQAESVEVRAPRPDGHYSGWLLLDSVDTKKFGDAFGAALGNRSQAAAGPKSASDFWFRLKDGTVIKAAVSGDAGLVGLLLPGWEHYEQYTSTGLRDMVRLCTDKAKQIERYPVRDLPAMRRSMNKAVRVSFSDGFDTSSGRRFGELADAATVARLVDLVWPDNMGFSKEHVPDRYVFALTFEMDNGEKISVDMGNTGLMAVYNGASLLRSADIVPEENVKAIHQLLALNTPDGAFRSLRQWVGDDSSITTARSQFISDVQTWASVWADHIGNKAQASSKPPQLPDVNFEKEIVLAVFGGKSINSLAYIMATPLKGRYEYIARVVQQRVQSMGKGRRTTPYGIFVLPRVDRPVRLEENVQSMIGQPPIWKELKARYQPLDTPRHEIEGCWAPTRKFEGGDSHIEQHEIHVVRDRDSFDKLWQRHAGAGAQSPDVDFDKSIVVAVFGGKQTGNFGKVHAYRIQECYAEGPGGVLRFAGEGYHGEKSHTPYGIWVLPRVAGAVHVEEREYPFMPDNAEIFHSDPPRWMERKPTK